MPPTSEPDTTSAEPLLWVARTGVLLGLAAMLGSLFARGDLLQTEIVSWLLARDGPRMLLARLTATADSPATLHLHGGPLYHALLWGWMRLGQGEIALRSFSLLAGLAALALLWSTARRLGRREAAILIALCATSPMLVDWLTSARAYGLYFLLACASSVSLLGVLWAADTSAARRAAGAYLLSTVALLYTHHFALLLLIAQAVAGVLAALMRVARPRRALLAAASWVLAGLAALPLVPLVQLHAGTRAVHLAPRPPGLLLEGSLRAFGHLAWSLLRGFDYVTLGDYPALEWGWSAAWSLGLAMGLVVAWRRARALLLVVACLALVPLALDALLVGLSPKPSMGLRYFIYLVPVLHLPVALLLARGPWRATGAARHLPTALLGLALALNLAACAFGFATLSYAPPAGLRAPRDQHEDFQPWRLGTDWRALAAALGEDPARAVLLESIKDAPYAAYYLPGVTVVSMNPERPRDGDAVQAQIALLTLRYPEVWDLSPLTEDVRFVDQTDAAIAPATPLAFGALQVTPWRRRAAGVEPFAAVAGPVGASVRQPFAVGSAGLAPVAALGRLDDAPPFAAGMRIAVDGAEVARAPVGVHAALLYEVRPWLEPGEHVLELELLAPRERRPGSAPGHPPGIPPPRP
ncbi:MAG: glycosyltransferase family 39 protein [Pseudomonadota bacterium]